MRVALTKRRNSNGVSYVADFRIGKKRIRKALGSNKFLAQAAAEEIERGLLLGTSNFLHRNRKLLVSELAKEYLDATASRRRPRTQYEELNRFKNSILPAFGDLRISEISQRHIEHWISERFSSGLKPGTVNRHIVSLKAMFQKAVEWDYLPKSPASRIKKLKEPLGSARFLSKIEAQQLLEASAHGPAHLYPLILLALHTGMRWSELRHLRWQDLDFQRNEIRIEITEMHQTKSGKFRCVPMTQEVREYFVERRGIGFLFGNPNGGPIRQLHKSFHSACKRAGITEFRFHDLRHTFASHLTMNGVPQRAIQELLGHGSGRMTERYSHLSPKHIHDAVKDFRIGFGDRQEKSGHVLDTFAKI